MFQRRRERKNGKFGMCKRTLELRNRNLLVYADHKIIYLTMGNRIFCYYIRHTEIVCKVLHVDI